MLHNIGEKSHQIYLSLALLLGDNLGLNQMLGFVQSFRANYFCRFCKTNRTLSEKQVFQDDSS